MIKNDLRLPSCLDVERHFLATIINKPVFISEYESLLNRELFFNETHALIFSCIKKCYNEYKTEFDQVMVTQTIKSLGFTVKDDIVIEDYIATMCRNNAVSGKVLKNYFKDLYKYHLIRQHIKNLYDAEKSIRSVEKGTLSDVIGKIDTNLAKCATSYIEDDEEPIDIYDGMQDYLEELAVQAQEEANFIIENPLPTANRWWGEFSAGDLIVFLAGPKVGKSTTLSNIADKVIKNNSNVKVLYLDTELETERVRRRIVSSKSKLMKQKSEQENGLLKKGQKKK